jgi:addiction module RelB/DinJ family antitoxin
MNTTLHVTIDRQTKEQAKNLAAEMGLDLSSIVKASLKTFVASKTFHVEKSYRMTPYLEQIIDEAYRENKTYGPFKTSAQSIKFLHSKQWK